MTNNKQQTEINAVEYLSKVNQFAKENNTGKPKQQTAIEWLEQEMLKPNLSMKEILEQAKEMEKEQIEQAELDAKEIIIIKHTEYGGGEQ
jgi:predicted transcriptional regulator